MCCAHSGNKGRVSGGGAAGSAAAGQGRVAIEDVPAGQPGRGAGHATGKGNKF